MIGLHLQILATLICINRFITVKDSNGRLFSQIKSLANSYSPPNFPFSHHINSQGKGEARRALPLRNLKPANCYSCCVTGYCNTLREETLSTLYCIPELTDAHDWLSIAMIDTGERVCPSQLVSSSCHTWLCQCQDSDSETSRRHASLRTSQPTAFSHNLLYPHFVLGEIKCSFTLENWQVKTHRWCR